MKIDMHRRTPVFYEGQHGTAQLTNRFELSDVERFFLRMGGMLRKNPSVTAVELWANLVYWRDLSTSPAKKHDIFQRLEKYAVDSFMNLQPQFSLDMVDFSHWLLQKRRLDDLDQARIEKLQTLISENQSPIGHPDFQHIEPERLKQIHDLLTREPTLGLGGRRITDLDQHAFIMHATGLGLKTKFMQKLFKEEMPFTTVTSARSSLSCSYWHNNDNTRLCTADSVDRPYTRLAYALT